MGSGCDRYPESVIEDFWLNALYSVTPTILVGLIFWFVLRAIIRSDRSERAVHAQIEAEERAKFEAEQAAEAEKAARASAARSEPAER